MRIRGFEKISFNQFKKDFVNCDNLKQIYEDIKLPKRSTSESAGYDFYAPYDFVLKPQEITKVPTAIKAYMLTDEFFAVLDKSGIGFKYNIRLCNQFGIIDADYYNNENNEGNIWIAFQNEGTEFWKVNKGDKMAQGIFQKYLKIDSDESNGKRNGGLGSTGKRDDNNE